MDYVAVDGQVSIDDDEMRYDGSGEESAVEVNFFLKM